MKKKFSLIELLIVISVISILISLLLPALAKARDKGYTVKCLGNMRQIISAQQQYSSDFADFMIVQAAETSAFRRLSWAYLIVPPKEATVKAFRRPYTQRRKKGRSAIPRKIPAHNTITATDSTINGTFPERHSPRQTEHFCIRTVRRSSIVSTG